MTLSDGKDRLQKLIANAGLCSRREAEEWIAAGRVSLNGNVATLGQSAGPGDDVRVDGSRLRMPKKLYFCLNKPAGYVTTLRDIYGAKTVMELVRERQRLIPVGRLDKDTTGLLLLTNDGDFANKVMHPSFEVEKTYEAALDKPFAKQDAAKLLAGVKLKEGFVRCSSVRFAGKTVTLTLHVGYNHVVKRVLHEFGYWVNGLSRTRIGPVRLDIPSAAYRPLTDAEVSWFLARPARSPPRRQRARRPRQARQDRPRRAKAPRR